MAGIFALLSVAGCVGMIAYVSVIAGNDPKVQDSIKMLRRDHQLRIEENRHRAIESPDLPTYTLSQFNQIQTGMTLDQVVAIMGESGNLVKPEVGTLSDSEGKNKLRKLINGLDVYKWENPNPVDGAVSVMFKEGKVYSKTEFLKGRMERMKNTDRNGRKESN